MSYTDGESTDHPGYCLCLKCQERRGQAKRAAAAKAAAAMDVAQYKRQLAEATADLELDGGHEPLVMPVQRKYDHEPGCGCGCEKPVRVTQVSPGVWRPDPAGTHLVHGNMMSGARHYRKTRPVRYAEPVTQADEASTIMVPASPLPDCACGVPQSRDWEAHGPRCPARTRLKDLFISERKAQDEVRRALAVRDRRLELMAADVPEDPVEVWQAEMRQLGKGLTYAQLVSEVPDQPAGMCVTCRLMPSRPGSAKCEDCAQLAPEPAIPAEPGCQCGCKGRSARGSAAVKAIPARAYKGTGVRQERKPCIKDSIDGTCSCPGCVRHKSGKLALSLTVFLGTAFVALAMAGVYPLIIPGIVLLGCALALILKGR